MKSGIRCLLAAAIMVSANPPRLRAAVTMGAEEAFFGEIPVVVTASKKAETIDQAPGVMYVYSREQIAQKGFKNIGDLLETVPGFSAQTSFKDLQFLQQVRGIASGDNEAITIMINGHKIDMFAEPGLLYGPINLDNVDRVEIIIGPGSVLYGAETLSAIVNLIIETPKKDVIVTAGTQDYYSVTGMSGAKVGDDVDLLVTATGIKRGGYKGNMSQRINDHKLMGEEYPSYFLYGQSRIKDWTLSAMSYNDRKPELNIWAGGGLEGTFYNEMSQFIVNNKSKWTDKLSTTLDISYDGQRFMRLATVVPAGGTHETYDLTQQIYRTEGALQFQSDKNYFQGGAKFTLRQNPSNYYMSWNPADPSAGGATVVSEVRNMDIRELGFYVSDDFKVFDGLKLTAASRADHSTILPTKRYTFSPRLAAVADPASFWTSKLMFNKATRYPAPWATTLNGWQGLGNPYAPGWAAANPMANKPETMTAYEFQNIIRAGSHRISLNLYYQVLKDYITWAFPFTNVGDFKGTGAELDARGKIVTNLGYTLGASFNHNVLHPSGVNGPFWAPTSPAIATNDQGEMNGVARFSAVGGLDYSFTEAVSGSFTGRYLTHQSVEDYDRFLSPGGYGHYYNRFWLDAGLVWKAVKTKDGGVSVQLFGRNLLNNGARVAQQFNNGWINPRGRFLGLSLDYSWGKVQ